MFSDDTSMWAASDSVPELQHLLRDEITVLEKWMWDNKLTLIGKGATECWSQKKGSCIFIEMV